MAAEFDHSHSQFARVLSQHVKDSLVDYAGLKENSSELDAYLEQLASVPPDDFKKWTKEQQLALYLNLYNAQTLRLIINYYPLKSIRKIGFLPGAAWRIQNVRFGGHVITLDHLENGIIRKDFNEPRIHFALVCAAMGCPPLRGEPFVARTLDRQLDDQTRRFLATTEKNRFEATSNTLRLSSIFKWYDEDFTTPAGSLENYVQPFLPEPAGAALKRATKVKVEYTDYDWALNEWKK
jgi:hypothetical protein